MRKMALCLLLATSCVAEAQVEIQSGGGEATPVVTTDPQPAEAEPPGAFSADDLCAVRDAIVAALRASSEEWAPAVADETAAADCRIGDDGTARIGPWSVATCAEDCEGRPMRFLYRAPGAQVPSYAAEVVRQGDAFTCTDLGQFMVVPTGFNR